MNVRVLGRCAFTFSDPAFAQGERMATYYARAIQEPTERINADNLHAPMTKKAIA